MAFASAASADPRARIQGELDATLREKLVRAVGEVDGPHAGLRALGAVPADVPRRTAVAAWLDERAGDLQDAATLYAEAAASARNVAERNHLNTADVVILLSL